MEWSWRDEFKLKSFTLQHEEPSEFSICRWQKDPSQVNGWFIFYRCILVIFCCFILLSSFFVYGWNYWWIYLTDLGFLGLTLHLAVAAATAIKRLLVERDERTLFRSTSLFYSVRATKKILLDDISWVFYNLATTISFVVSIVYWGALYESGTGIDIMDFMVHGVNVIIVVLDIFISARPWRLMHFYQGILAMLCYVNFTVFYWLAGGQNLSGDHYIYPVMDWNNPDYSVAFTFIGIALMIPLHCFLWLLHFLRDAIYKKISHRKESSSSLWLTNSNSALATIS